MADYAFCRLCDRRHNTHSKAFDDLAGLVAAGHYYTQRRKPPNIVRGTPLVGIAAHGGRGLFLLGICRDLDWERLSAGDDPYRYRIGVLWDRTIYAAKYGNVISGAEKYNERGWTNASRADYRRVVTRILGGQQARPVGVANGPG